MCGFEPTIEDGADLAMSILYDGDGAIYRMMVEEDVQIIMLAPSTSITSDGYVVTYGDDLPHLRNQGTFPRVVRKYVKEDGVLALEQALHRMTALIARRIGLNSRGVLSEGVVAHINVFDGDTVTASGEERGTDITR